MAVTFNQTDLASVAGAIQACSSFAPAASAIARLASIGGTLGSASHVITIPAGVTRSGFMFELFPGRWCRWSTGNGQVNLNVTAGNANIRWDWLYVCRLNAAGASVATLGTVQPSVLLDSVSVFSQLVEMGALTAAADDRAYVSIGLTNLAGTDQSVTIKPDQTIVTPWTMIPGPFEVVAAECYVPGAVAAMGIGA